MSEPNPQTYHCLLCEDEAWVCEAHPNKPMDHGGENDIPGCGVGMPCHECNASEGLHDPPRMPPVDVIREITRRRRSIIRKLHGMDHRQLRMIRSLVNELMELETTLEVLEKLDPEPTT